MKILQMIDMNIVDKKNHITKIEYDIEKYSNDEDYNNLQDYQKISDLEFMIKKLELFQFLVKEDTSLNIEMDENLYQYYGHIHNEFNNLFTSLLKTIKDLQTSEYVETCNHQNTYYLEGVYRCSDCDTVLTLEGE